MGCGWGDGPGPDYGEGFADRFPELWVFLFGQLSFQRRDAPAGTVVQQSPHQVVSHFHVGVGNVAKDQFFGSLVGEERQAERSGLPQEGIAVVSVMGKHLVRPVTVPVEPVVHDDPANDLLVRVAEQGGQGLEAIGAVGQERLAQQVGVQILRAGGFSDVQNRVGQAFEHGRHNSWVVQAPQGHSGAATDNGNLAFLLEHAKQFRPHRRVRLPLGLGFCDGLEAFRNVPGPQALDEALAFRGGPATGQKQQDNDKRCKVGRALFHLPFKS
jgi:hypothetical protein